LDASAGELLIDGKKGLFMVDVLGVVAYTTGFIIALLGRSPLVCTLCVALGLSANLSIVINQYLHALPMMPMHIGIAGISSFLTIIWICSYGSIKNTKSEHDHLEGLILLGIILLIILLTILFPKNFYLPFLRSNTIWAHIFLLSGILAKSCLIYGGVKAFISLQSNRSQNDKKIDYVSATNWIVYGYGFLSVSLFSGELWSYLGWGTPVVWHDAALTTVLALWLYWSCFLHLLFINSWSKRQRTETVVAGAALVLIFSCHPDMGPFRFPFHFSG